ncbi:hypothetical protein OIU79_015353 [Salix purpurea]|uniref:Ribosome maturation factor RimP N-terminal domain-containing protein n=1 Tax=Salix purpurea TaxID=77065 RepID=A0A9Q0PBT5_SALPP|nr:hypothetical protein OIU79_015353 [Salix purpurea]
MNLISPWNVRFPPVSIPPITAFPHCKPSLTNHFFSFPFWPHPFRTISTTSFLVHAKKRNSKPEPVLEPAIIEQVSGDDEDKEEQLLFDDFEDGAVMDGDDEEFLEDEAEQYVGDGGGGGGIALAGTWWDKEALKIAEETLSNSTIQVRIERLTNKSGSPNMEDIEAFSTTYRARLDEAELAKTITENTTLEVSSPGVERVVRIPEDLDRFKDRAMYVKYVNEADAEDSSSERDGVLRLVSFDMETKYCTWGLADVRVNREKSREGKTS